MIMIIIQIHFLGEESHSPKTLLLKLCASEFPREEKHQASKERGLGPWVAVGPKGGAPPLGGLGGGLPQSGGGREEGKGDFVGGGVIW